MAHESKFDPARAHLLDGPEREAYLPSAQLVALLDLQGGERVLDYGAGTGRLSLAAAQGGATVVAIDENPEMFDLLAERVAAVPNVEALLIRDNHVPLPAASVQRVLAVNVLHEIRGETALGEMRRLLARGGFALIVDWERGRERSSGPPDELRYSLDGAIAELAAAGLRPNVLSTALPFHYAIRAHKE